MPPRKGRKHVLRVIREILFFEPKGRGTRLRVPLEFMLRVLPHLAIAVLVSDFLDSEMQTGQLEVRPALTPLLRQANRKHDLVAVRITDPFESALPDLGRLVIEDAETGEVVEIDTGDEAGRAAFAAGRERERTDRARLLRSVRIDHIELCTGQPYSAALGQFFRTREKRRLHG